MANENRKATVKSFVALMKFASQHAGLVAQSYRAYEGPRLNSRSKTQREVANAISKNGCSISQGDLSKFENGKVIPETNELQAVMSEYGFDMSNNSGGEALRKFLEWHRDHFKDLEKLTREEPK